jgi:hypothetical protein
MSARTKKCPVPNCWEKIGEHQALCRACTSWWYRMALRDAHDLARYMKRLSRMNGRVERSNFLDYLAARRRRAA